MRRKLISVYFFIILFFISGFDAIVAQTDSSQKSKRPTVGLVMSGGGAKGWAYLGVLRVLQEAGLDVDYISGASAGSIVGAMYALGYHPDTIESIIRTQDWDAIMKDVIERRYIAYVDKLYKGNYIFTLPIREKKIELKASLYEGQNIDLLLNRYYSVAYKDSLFKDFQTPFLCIGTDLYEGKEIVLDRGYLPLAIRSSMAIPAYFAPVDYQGYYLVDGGVVNNYPVTPLKNLGVDIIIGADVQSGDKRTKEDLQNLTTILDQIIGYHRQEENKKGREETDIYIHLKMPYNMMDFNNYDSIINFGEKVAREHFDEIKALADSLNEIEYKPIKSYTTVPLDTVEISEVKYIGNVRVGNKYLESFFGEFRNSKVAIKDLEDAVNYTYGTRFFQSVFYELEYVNGKTNLLIKIKESDPGNLSAGIHYDNDYKGAILANLTVRNVLGPQSKLFVNLVLGNYPMLNGLYLIDRGKKPGIGIDFDLYTFDFDTYNGSEKINQWKFDNFSTSVFIPISVENIFGFAAGFKYQYFRFKQKIVTDSVADGYNTFSSFGDLFIRLGTDTRDKNYFSTKGALVDFKATYKTPFSKDWNKELFENSLVVYLKWNQNIRLAKRFTLQPGLFLGATFTQNGLITDNVATDNDGVTPVPVQNRFWVGGLNQYNYEDTFVPFTGLKFVQSQGVYAAIGRLNLQYNVYKKIYATAMLDVGQNQRTWEKFWDGRYIMAGYGLKASYNSFIGPVEGSIMWSNMLPGATFFLNIGFWLN